MQFNALIEPPVQAVEEQGPVWLEGLPARVYQTPQYGEVLVSPDKLQRFVSNFKNNVRGQIISTDFEHGMDRSKGLKASGEIVDVKLAPSSEDPNNPALWLNVNFTEEAKSEVEAKQWRYFSLDWEDVWYDNDGNEHQDVIVGGGLTNRPVAKKMLPINFSEAMWEDLDEETRKQFALWDTAYVNNLPDSAFLYVESGGSKDGEGKTTPRSLRKLPYKDSSGKIDLPHLRNAIARAPQMTGTSDADKARIQAYARKLLTGASKMGEAAMTELLAESKEWEHSEPGTGSPPAPRTKEDGSDDPAITQGWRRPTPPDQTPGQEGPDNTSNSHTNPPVVAGTTTGSRGGSTSMEGEYVFSEHQAQNMLRVLGLPVDAKPEAILEAVQRQDGELSTLRQGADKVTQEKAFAEQYPAFWQEHNNLMKRDRENTAVRFAESATTVRRAVGNGLVDTPQGLSAMARQKVVEFHVKFAEGVATSEDFEECIKAITNGGIITFGEIGSGRKPDDIPDVDLSSPAGISQSRKVFAEVIANVKKDNPDLTTEQAMEKAALDHPDLAAAYRIATPA